MMKFKKHKKCADRENYPFSDIFVGPDPVSVSQVNIQLNEQLESREFLTVSLAETSNQL